MISEANGHPRHAVDDQRVQSKPGHPHATVVVSKLYTVREQKQAGKRKKVKNRVSDSVTVRDSTVNKEYVPENRESAAFFPRRRFVVRAFQPRQQVQQEFAGGIFVSVVNLRHSLVGIPLFGGRPMTTEPEITAKCFLRAGIPYEREGGRSPNLRSYLRDGKLPPVRHGVHDNRLRLNDRPGRTETVAGRMDLVDIVPTLHFQETALENTVRNPVLMHLGSLEKPDGVFRQRDLRERETGRRDSQIRSERRRGFDIIGKVQRTEDNQRGGQEEKERSVFHHIVGEHKNRAEDRAEDRGADLQEEGSLRLD